MSDALAAEARRRHAAAARLEPEGRHMANVVDLARGLSLRGATDRRAGRIKPFPRAIPGRLRVMSGP